MSQRILVFGDSIAEGFWDKEGGWVDRLKRDMNNKAMLHRRFWSPVLNLGISGDMTTDLLERFTQETEMREDESHKAVIIFAIGINDSAYVHRIGNPRVSEARFERNIEQLIKQAKKFTKAVLFLANTPVEEKKVYFKPWIGAFGYKNYYSNERIGEYNSIMKKLCRLHKVYFLDVPPDFKSANYGKLLFDGLHPNSRGHELIFKNVLNFLLSEKLISVRS